MKNNTLHQKHKIRYSRRQKHKIRYSRRQKHKPRNNKTKNSLTRRITEGGGGFFRSILPRSILPVSKKKQRELEEEEYKIYLEELEEKNKLARMETEQALKIEEAGAKYYAELEREKALAEAAAAANNWPSWPPFVHDALKRLKGTSDTPVENDTPDTTLTDTGFGRGAGYSLDEYRYW